MRKCVWIVTATLLAAGIPVATADGTGLRDISVVWQTDVPIPPRVERFEIRRVKLTADGQYLIVFHYTGDHTGGTTNPGWVEKLDPADGQIVWQKELREPGMKLTPNGWVDAGGNVYVMAQWGGYTLWKRDLELETEIWEYSDHSSCSFEYVTNVITDDLGNVYVAAYCGSGSGVGSKALKLSRDGHLVWECISRNTGGKDMYTEGLALDSVGNLFRVGADRPNGGNGFQDRARLTGHSATNGEEILNYVPPESSSRAHGVIVDSEGYVYIAYSHNRCGPDGQPSLEERTVVQKLEQDKEGTVRVVWEYAFEDVGIFTSPDALGWYTAGSFYLLFHVRLEGEVYPGLALFDLAGNLIGRWRINRPGWGFARSGFDVDVTSGRIYVGLTQLPFGLGAVNTEVLALRPCPGDVNGDGDCDLNDLALLLAVYRTCEGDPDFDPHADLNCDGCVDLADLAILLGDYGCGVP